MSATANVMKRTRKGGQTLIIALLIMGILLILGLVFLGLISRNIVTQSRFNQRSVGNDLAEAGIRYAHGQLLTSGLGADWRVPLTANVNPRDPDFDLLQPGGPDGLGNYGRVNFDQGRVLVRARYGPSDANVFDSNPNGPLILPGRAKNYIIIESIGKPGKLNPSDPTTARDLTGAERERLQTRKLIAFASVGLIEQAFFVTNKFKVSRAAEFGAANEIGVTYGETVGGFNPVQVPTQIGDVQMLPNQNGTGFTMQPFGGGARFQSDVVFHGPIFANINKYFGESILGTGSFTGADDLTTSLNINATDIDAGTGVWAPFNFTLTNGGANSLNSRNSNFSTARGTVRDGVASADNQGFTRGTRYMEPASFQGEDGASKESVYRTMARDSGAVLGGGNSGKFGHGRNVYVNNNSDRQNRVDEQGREIQGSDESLIYDWLNPNNSQSNSGWQGAFYVPRGAYLQLLPDGFLIMRDSRGSADELFWRDVNGADSGNSVARYRIVRNGAGKLFIANTYTNFGGPTIDSATPAQIQSAGFPFDGVLYFEGNVRVRGSIPTDVQLTVVSGATIYIEGSITKGVVRTPAAFDQGGPAGERIRESSRSMLMLAAKDYVALNTSQFFGPAPSQVIEEVNDLPSGLEYNPIRMRRQATPGTPSSYQFRSDLLLNPAPLATDAAQYAANPSMWRSFAGSYQEFGTSNFIDAGILITHTMDDGPAANSFVSLDVNFGVDNPGTGFTSDWQYLFDLNAGLNPYDPYQVNNVADYSPFNVAGYTDPNYGAAQANRAPIYGIGAESWQRYGRFESTFFPVARSAGEASPSAFPVIPSANEHGTYMLLAQETNDFTFRFNDVGFNASNDYLIARAAMVPNDIRIEASVFAEDGSFFVIPSPWFNPNPNDRRDTYVARVSVVGQAQAQAERLQNYGASPMTPFYGEPIDVKVRIIGSVSQNMPVAMSQQVEWIKKWGWIPRSLGDSGRRIPSQHVPAGLDLNSALYVPNLVITYDPALGSGRSWDPTYATQGPFFWQNPALRVDDDGRMLPPMPRLPVSPTLAYFGEVNQ